MSRRRDVRGGLKRKWHRAISLASSFLSSYGRRIRTPAFRRAVPSGCSALPALARPSAFASSSPFASVGFAQQPPPPWPSLRNPVCVASARGNGRITMSAIYSLTPTHPHARATHTGPRTGQGRGEANRRSSPAAAAAATGVSTHCFGGRRGSIDAWAAAAGAGGQR